MIQAGEQATKTLMGRENSVKFCIMLQGILPKMWPTQCYLGTNGKKNVNDVDKHKIHTQIYWCNPLKLMLKWNIYGYDYYVKYYC